MTSDLAAWGLVLLFGAMLIFRGVVGIFAYWVGLLPEKDEWFEVAPDVLALVLGISVVGTVTFKAL